jgi:hypothetical protein
MRWCRYAIPPGVPDAAVPGAGSPVLEGVITFRTGRFVSGGLPNQASARQVVAAAVAESGAAPDAAPCEPASAAFVVLWPLKGGQAVGSAVTAELDGCGRLFTDGREPRPLPADLRDVLTALPTG